MQIIIDGYNLLHASGVDPGKGPGTLEQARMALLRFLSQSLSDEERQQTTIVFDAANAPRGLPSRYAHNGMTVLFARDQGEADALIEDLIEAEGAPKELIVVSSDHRLHRAARRRKAKAIDSDDWFFDVVRRNRVRQSQTVAPEKPIATPSRGEVSAWLKYFGMDETSFEPTSIAPLDRNVATESQAIHADEIVKPTGPMDAPRNAVNTPNGSTQIDKDPPTSAPKSSRPPRLHLHRKRRFGGSTKSDRQLKNEGPIPDASSDEPLFPPGFGEGILEE